jgi:hypothetical protein
MTNDIYSDGRIPYFYVIREKKTGMYYAGCKYGTEADPTKLLRENGYMTSSNVVRKIILAEGIESFEVVKVKTFSTSEQSYQYETRFLQKVDAKNNPRFYNGHNNDITLPSYGSEKYKLFMISKYGVENPSFCPEIISKQVKTKNSSEWKDTVGAQSTQKELPRYRTNRGRALSAI